MTTAVIESRSLSANRISRVAALLFFGLLAGILFAEILLRVMYEDVSIGANYWGTGAFVADKELGYLHRPGFKGRAYRRDAFDIPVTISAEGFRQSDVPAQMKYGSRALILGDSFAFGLGVREENGFAHLIQPELNRNGIGVLNASQTGYSVEQEVRFGKRIIKSFSPQIVIVCLFPGNDFEADLRKNFLNVDVVSGQRLPKDRTIKGSVFDYLRTHMYVWRYLESHVTQHKTQKRDRIFKAIAKENPQKAISGTMQSLKDMRDFCDIRNIQLGVVVIPSVLDEKFLMKPLRDELRNLNVPVLDLLKHDFGDSDKFENDGHWNETGHRKAASLIGPFVLQLKESAVQK